MKKSVKARDSYGLVFDRVAKSQDLRREPSIGGISETQQAITNGVDETNINQDNNNMALIPTTSINNNSITKSFPTPAISSSVPSNQIQLLPKKAPAIPKPKWHPPWKLYRVISGMIKV